MSAPKSIEGVRFPLVRRNKCRKHDLRTLRVRYVQCSVSTEVFQSLSPFGYYRPGHWGSLKFFRVSFTSSEWETYSTVGNFFYSRCLFSLHLVATLLLHESFLKTFHRKFISPFFVQKWMLNLFMVESSKIHLSQTITSTEVTQRSTQSPCTLSSSLLSPSVGKLSATLHYYYCLNIYSFNTISYRLWMDLEWYLVPDRTHEKDIIKFFWTRISVRPDSDSGPRQWKIDTPVLLPQRIWRNYNSKRFIFYENPNNTFV